MRSLVIVLSLCACGDDDSGGGPGPLHDAALDDGGGDGGSNNINECAATGLCPSGPMCGDGCCQRGERCVEGTCMCGDQSACGPDDTCMSGGPAQPTHGCGLFCCGLSTGGCPI